MKKEKKEEKSGAHMSVLVQFVVRQLHFLKGNHLLHQLLAGEWRVWVDVQPAGKKNSTSDWLKGVRFLSNQRSANWQIKNRLATNQLIEITINTVM